MNEIDAHDMDDASWWQNLHEAEEQLVADHRAALLRVAKGAGSYTDAVMLAAALNHQDLFPHVAENNATAIEDDPE